MEIYKYKKEIEVRWQQIQKKANNKYESVPLNITVKLISDYKFWKSGNRAGKIGTFLETRESDLGITDLVPKWCKFIKSKGDDVKLDTTEHYEFLKLVKDKAGQNADLNNVNFSKMYDAFNSQEGQTTPFPISGENGFVSKCTEWLKKEENNGGIAKLLTEGTFPEKK